MPEELRTTDDVIEYLTGGTPAVFFILINTKVGAESAVTTAVGGLHNLGVRWAAKTNGTGSVIAAAKKPDSDPASPAAYKASLETAIAGILGVVSLTMHQVVGGQRYGIGTYERTDQQSSDWRAQDGWP